MQQHVCKSWQTQSGPHAGPRVGLCPWGGWGAEEGLGVGLQSGFAVGLIWVSQMLGENETSLHDLVAPALSLLSQPATTLGFRQSPNQEVLPYTPPPLSPTYAHASRNCTHAHAHLHWGKGNAVMTALNQDARGYHYKMAPSHVQRFNHTPT